MVEFVDRDGFKIFTDRLLDNVGTMGNIYVTGYFSETVRESLERLAKMPHKTVKLITQEFDVNNKRERKNLEVLKKLCKAGVEVKVNNRIHARFLVAYNIWTQKEKQAWFGLLVIGSFDFNTECIGKERYDAGIKTKHPDLIKAAALLFEDILNDTESIPLLEKYPTT
jgi:hypothetical protein